MTLHVLHAGDGYSYLTRQVASADRELERGEKLTEYYTAHGTPPGRWFGSGLEAIAEMDAAGPSHDGGDLAQGAAVSEQQMKALFGEGKHPNATAIINAIREGGTDHHRAEKVASLGSAFRTFDNDNQVAVAQKAAIESWVSEHERTPTAGEQYGIELGAARPLFVQANGRKPADDGELSRWAKAQKSSARQPVAGFDLVFTPSKSASVAWGLGDDTLRRQIEQIHQQEVHAALRFLEREAVFTRRGRNGVEQVDTTGIIATLYDHYDSRAGDPNLHTHAAVSNKVHTAVDGKWRTIDGATLHRYAVAASQQYNARVMHRIADECGFSLRERSTGRGSQNVIELAEVPQALCDGNAQRRQQIETAYPQLLAEFRERHGGRMPGPKEQFALFQQANLASRAGKQEGESLADKRRDWWTRSAALVGGEKQLSAITDTWGHKRLPGAANPGLREFNGVDVESARLLRTVQNKRATWSHPHLVSAAHAQLAGVAFPSPERRDRMVDKLVAKATSESIPLPTPVLPATPNALTRRDGQAVWTRHGAQKYTSAGVLASEKKLLDACAEPSAHIALAEHAQAARLAVEQDTGRRLNSGQVRLAEHFTGAGTQLAVGVGPAGTGKTTSMQLVADTWRRHGHQVIGLAPSKVAANELADAINTPAHTLATLTRRWQGETGPAHTLPAGFDIPAGTMLLVDEASLAATTDLAAVTDIAEQTGAVVRLLGDPAQLDAIETGGAFRLLVERQNAPELNTVVRFGDDTAQADASLQLRKGDTAAAELYAQRGWIHHGGLAELREQIITDHLADHKRGAHSVILAATREEVAGINADIQAIHRRDGQVDAAVTAGLADDLAAGAGDTVVTRLNNRDLRVKGGRGRGRDVANGDLWTVQHVHSDGALTVVHQEYGGRVTLPPAYVAEHVEVGYASSIHRAQGITVDHAKVLAGGEMNRAGLYVGVTRGRERNEVYVPLDTQVGPDTEGMHLGEIPAPPADDAAAARQIIERIITTDTGQLSAHEQIRRALGESRDPARLREAYLAAYERLSGARDRHIGDIVDTYLDTMPTRTADTTTVSGRDALIRVLGRVYDAGDDPLSALAAAEAHVHEWKGTAAAARDITAALTAHVDTPEQSGRRGVLPPLPPEAATRGGDEKVLRRFAEQVRRDYQAQQPRADADHITATWSEYQNTRDTLDYERIRSVLADALDDPAAARRIAADEGAWRIGGQIEQASRIGLDPADVIRAPAAAAAESAGGPGQLTAGELTRPVAKQIQDACTQARAEWLTQHREVLAEHLPALRREPDDPRWDGIADRLMTRQHVTGETIDDLAAALGDRTGSAAPVGTIDDILRSAAPTGTIEATPAWVPAPPPDADDIDPALADTAREQYRRLATEHARHVADAHTHLAGDNAPAWTRELGERPSDDAQLARRWDHAAADAQLYRQVHQVTDTASLAGPEPEHAQRDQRRAYNQVQTANRRQHDAQAQARQAAEHREQQRRTIEQRRAQQRRDGPERGPERSRGIGR